MHKQWIYHYLKPYLNIFQGTPTATRVIMNQALSQLRQETSATPVVQATSLSNIVMVPAQYVQQLTSVSRSCI